MGRKSRRSVYDPSIMDRVDMNDDIQPLDGGGPDPLAYDSHDDLDEAEMSLPNHHDAYETQETEVLDPKFHNLQRTHKNRGRNRCLVALALAGLLAIIVTVSVLVSKNNKAASSAESSSTETLSPPPPDLVETCVQGYQSNDLSLCTSYCSPAECCQLPSNYEFSCLNGNEDTCLSYHQGCYVLDLQPGTDLNPQVVLPPPPASLVEDCVQGYQNNDLGVCETYCEPADCCQLPSNFDLSCLKGNEDTCLSYHQGCYVLSLPPETSITPAEPNSVPPAPLDLAAKCDINILVDKAGLDACTAYCDPYQCCYEEGSGNCAQNNPSCVEYAPCLNLRAQNTIDTAISDQVNSVCLYDSVVSRLGRKQCRDACKLAQCCFVGNKECGPDRGDPVAFCDQYEPCEILYGGNLPDLPVGANGEALDDEVWDDDDFLADDDTLAGDDVFGKDDEAVDALEDDDAVDDFLDDANIVEEVNPVLPDPDPGLQPACDRTLGTFNQAMCANLCSPAQCCQFSASLPQSCLAGNNWKCMVYQKNCASIYGNQEQTGTLPNVPLAPENIADICSPASLSTTDGLQSCTDICTPGKCCYDWSHEQCAHDTDCRSYASCLNLHTMNQDHPVVTEVVKKTCTETNIQDPAGFAQCQQICQQYQCCYQEDAPSCPLEVCELYTGCKFIHIDNNPTKPIASESQPQLPMSSTDLEAICATATEECTEACGKGGCCSLPEGVDGSCLRGHHYECLQYHRICAVLDANIKPSDNSAVVPQASPYLSEYCTGPQMSVESVHQKCLTNCNLATCCWAVGLASGESCRDKGECAAYGPCLSLVAGETVNSNITTEVTEKCTEDTLDTDAGLAVCLQVCSQHRCCWDKNMAQSEICYAETACDQYTACENLQQYVDDDTLVDD